MSVRSINLRRLRPWRLNKGPQILRNLGLTDYARSPHMENSNSVKKEKKNNKQRKESKEKLILLLLLIREEKFHQIIREMRCNAMR